MKSVATGILCSVLCALTACGGGGSSGGKPKSSSSVAVSSASVAVSSAALSSTPASSSGVALSSAAPSSTPASSVASSEVASSVVSSSSSSVPVAQTGVFVDSAVAGVKYETTPGAFTGYTSASGQYQFAEGDTVVFSIGDLKFPEVPAKGVVTPVDIAESADPVNAERIKTNIAALLQSLDIDGNPDNGISIDYATAETTAVAVEFNQSYADFAASPAVTALVANSGSTTTTLVSASVAVAHLEASLEKLLVGAWYIHGEGDGSVYDYVLFITDDNHYAAIDYDSSVINGAALEIGTYSWDQATGKVTTAITFATESGLDAVPPMANNNSLVLDGDTLALTDGDETFTLKRLKANEESPLQGGWSTGNEDEMVFFAFTDTHYFMGQNAEPESDGTGEPGIEVGTYTYNIQSKAIVVETLVDTNKQWGLSHPCAVLGGEAHPDYEESNYLACGPDGRDIVQTLAITGDTLTFISEADTIAMGDDPFELVRINELPDGDIHLKLTMTMTVETYVQGELFEISENGQVIDSMQCDRSDTPEDMAERTPGYVEEYDHAWVLASTGERPSWVGSLPATYNPATGAITLHYEEPLMPVYFDSPFFQRWDESFSGTYNPDSDSVIQGTFTETNHLSWNRNDSVSSCTTTYKVEARLR